MAKYDITAPDGSTWEVEAPDSASEADVLKYAQGQWQAQPAQEAPKQNAGTLANIGMGGIQGAADIGATLKAPLDYVQDLINRAMPNPAIPNEQPTNQKRRADIAEFFQNNADPESTAFQLSRLGTQIAGTAGVPGALAKTAAPVLGRVAPTVAPKLVTALESGGFKIGQKATTLPGKLANAAIRTGAGATVGATQAGLVNPDDAGIGAVIGGAMPGAFKVAGEAGKLAKRGTSALIRNTIGLATGTGGDAVSVAYQSGKAGNRAFLENMRGASADDIVAQAKEAIGNMRAERAAAYRSGMVDIKADKTVIDFAPINKAVAKISALGSFKGQQINKNAAGTVDDIAETVNKWANLDPAEFHTPEGLDALKQALGDIRDATQFGTPARRAADQAYNAVKGEINKQAPAYAKVMKEYTEASEALKEVEKAFSTGEKAAKDTTLRKLLSVMRNNVNTNFSNRKELAQTLVDNGAKDLFPSIAGQAMSSPTPRGLQQLAMTGSAVAGVSNPAFWATLPLQSPRLMGNAAYGLGRAAGATANAGKQAAGKIGTAAPGLLADDLALLRTLPLITLSGQINQR